MEEQLKVGPFSLAGREEKKSKEVVGDVAYKRIAIVNVIFVGDLRGGRWVLVDAGLPGSAGIIINAAESRFGLRRKPAAIILTHAHFDHVGALEELLEHWKVPVYAHALEHPYLTGQAAYPPPDPTVGGGLMSRLSTFFPNRPIDIKAALRPLPADGSVPEMRGWKWMHTPGHTPGHISLFRERDRSLIAGDAFVTTRQESVYSAVTQESEIHGPPMYYTQNFDQARESVRSLAELEPEFVVAGHGQAMKGEDMRRALHVLAGNFDELAVPEEGRYVAEPRTAESGTAYERPEHR